MLANVVVFGVHFVEHCFLVLQTHFHWQQEVSISVLDSLPSILFRRSIRRIMLACSGSCGPLNVRILLCNSSSLDSVDIVALAYLPGAFIIRVLVLTEVRENVLQVDNSESESGLALTLLWGGCIQSSKSKLGRRCIQRVCCICYIVFNYLRTRRLGNF